jgi:methylglyoxal synthase
MSDRVLRLFCVRCVNCETTLMTAPLLGSSEIGAMEDHVRACFQHDPLPAQPRLGDVMRLVRVAIVGTASETPPRLH